MTRRQAWALTVAKIRINFSKFLHRRLHVTTSDLTEQNCMGYAFNNHDWLELVNFYHSDPQSLEERLPILDECSEELCDLYSCREILEPASANKNERVIALRIGPTDFHFVRLDNKIWTHKPGMFPIKVMPNASFHADTWTNASGTVYDSPIRYFALRK